MTSEQQYKCYIYANHCAVCNEEIVRCEIFRLKVPNFLIDEYSMEGKSKKIGTSLGGG